MEPTSLLERAEAQDHRHVAAADPLPGALSQLTHRALIERVRAFADELRAGGLAPRQVVGLVGRNSLEWLIADLALLALGCVPCPIPEQSLLSDELPGLLERFGLTACIRVHVPPRGDELGYSPAASLPGVHVGVRLPAPATPVPADRTFTLAFSSGTSGTQKCLQVTWRGIENTIHVAAEAWKLAPGDNILVFLPYANMQQRSLSYTALWYGCDLTIARPECLFRALHRHPVSILVAPPSLYETVEKQSVGGRGPRHLLGHSLRLMFVGSAPVGSGTLEFYAHAGLPLFEVYGMNEFGWIAFNLPGDNRIGAAGRPLRGVELLETEDGEIVVRGRAPQSIGYYVDGCSEEAGVYVAPDTVATGDLGEIRSDGRLYLTGRKKNVIVTPAGHKIAPEPLEKRLESCDARIERAFVFLPEGESCLACMLWVSPRLDARARRELIEQVERSMGSLPSNEQMRRVLLGDATELTHESGLLTENGKPNRRGLLRAALSAEAPAL